ncbi:hypothetical protein [Roseomonas elaeocarpi]|uniref:Uncharacterized protein n=1 Tax=Roseomonas elaeocarpi TaxID=907779 RepID=A0ABV6JZ08_9PROT
MTEVRDDAAGVTTHTYRGVNIEQFDALEPMAYQLVLPGHPLHRSSFMTLQTPIEIIDDWLADASHTAMQQRAAE